MSSKTLLQQKPPGGEGKYRLACITAVKWLQCVKPYALLQPDDKTQLLLTKLTLQQSEAMLIGLHCGRL